MQNFQMLIVSAVKICKQCLQAASASGGGTMCYTTKVSHRETKVIWQRHARHLQLSNGNLKDEWNLSQL